MSNPPRGTAEVLGGGSIIRYTPDADENGTDTFTYTVTDGTFNETATVTVTITPVNDAPAFTSTPLTAIEQDQLYSYTAIADDIELVFTDSLNK